MLSVLLFLTACAPTADKAGEAAALRTALLGNGGCSFVGRVGGDFGVTGQ